MEVRTWWNGRPAQAAELESMALSGYGCYTFFQVRERAVRGLSLHLERLRTNALDLFGRAPEDSLVRRFLDTAVDSGPCSVRVTLLVPDQSAVLSGAALLPDVVVTTSAPRPGTLAPLAVRTTSYLRETPYVKHRGTHGLTRETRAARQAGFDDALLVGPAGTVTEGSTWNLLLHDGRTWVWPQGPMLPGVTAALVRQAMTAAGIAHRQQQVSTEQLSGFVAAFALNASSPDRSISAIDGAPLPGDPAAAAQLRQLWATVEAEPLA